MHRNIDGKRKYVFRKYSKVYRSLFNFESERLYACLGRNNVAIEHIGSTAVPGLGGKNILDITIGAKKGRPRRLLSKLADLGYGFTTAGGNTRRLFLFKDTKYRRHNVRIHLHVVKFKGYEWGASIAFRNYLIKHRNALLEYGRVKKRAVTLARGRKEVYKREKGRFIDNIMKKALR
jgi:GrpB-like predicted nucleotidyltransferase (UPF0157 family)